MCEIWNELMRKTLKFKTVKFYLMFSVLLYEILIHLCLVMDWLIVFGKIKDCFSRLKSELWHLLNEKKLISGDEKKNTERFLALELPLSHNAGEETLMDRAVLCSVRAQLLFWFNWFTSKLISWFLFNLIGKVILDILIS